MHRCLSNELNIQGLKFTEAISSLAFTSVRCIIAGKCVWSVSFSGDNERRRLFCGFFRDVLPATLELRVGSNADHHLYSVMC